MKANDFKTMVQVKLELLRGCCLYKGISKKKIEESIREFADKIEKIEIEPEGK